ncbi:MAG: Sec-independent protein translocase TatB [Actinomycetales bacterium]|nr:Sec-independent protein translocase TatB [Actinomycetales bacterium]
MFGINGGELLVLLLLAAVLIGPERLPRYAEQLARWVRTWRATLTTTRARLAEELGEDDVDWSALDPRRYDPRRIVREALAEPVGPPSSAARPAPRGAGAAGGAAGARPTPADPGAPAPFDDEAT